MYTDTRHHTQQVYTTQRIHVMAYTAQHKRTNMARALLVEVEGGGLALVLDLGLLALVAARRVHSPHDASHDHSIRFGRATHAFNQHQTRHHMLHHTRNAPAVESLDVLRRHVVVHRRALALLLPLLVHHGQAH